MPTFIAQLFRRCGGTADYFLQPFAGFLMELLKRNSERETLLTRIGHPTLRIKGILSLISFSVINNSL
jgi:hypothetical protein